MAQSCLTFQACFSIIGVCLNQLSVFFLAFANEGKCCSGDVPEPISHPWRGCFWGRSEKMRWWSGEHVQGHTDEQCCSPDLNIGDKKIEIINPPKNTIKIRYSSFVSEWSMSWGWTRNVERVRWRADFAKICQDVTCHCLPPRVWVLADQFQTSCT